MRQFDNIIFRLAAGSLGVLNRYLRDPFGKSIRQGWHECRLLVALHYRIDNMPPIRPQHASVIMHVYADNQRRQMVMQPRGVAPITPILPLLAPSADDIIASVNRLDQPRNLLWRILQVGVERDDDVAAAGPETRE